MVNPTRSSRRRSVQAAKNNQMASGRGWEVTDNKIGAMMINKNTKVGNENIIRKF
jgi:hypothetical protein